MTEKSIKKLKWFWAWQDEKEEAWLSEMAQEGLHLEKVGLPGVYHFQEGEPGRYVYRLDFQSLKSRDRESYLQLFEDAGWEHIGDMGGWVYFRHELNDEVLPEIFSDQESKLGKYQRVLIFLASLLPIMIILFPSISNQEGFNPVVSSILQGISAILLLLYTIAMVSIFRRISQIKNQPE